MAASGGDAGGGWRSAAALPAERLKRAGEDGGWLTFRTTAELPPLDGDIIGQERAVRAMEFGLRARGAGYHIYVAGPVGTGRSTFVQARLRQEAERQPAPPDWCYVFNFAQPERPQLITLPAGQGRRLQRQMEELVADVRSQLRRVFESQEYVSRKGAITARYEKDIERLWGEAEEKARERGFLLQRTITGLATVPLAPNGHPMSPEHFQVLPPSEQEEIRRRGQDVQSVVAEVARQVRALEAEARDALKGLDRQTAEYAVGQSVARLKEGYPDQPQVLAYLDAVAADVVDHLDLFLADRPEAPPAGPGPVPNPWDDAGMRYRVNVFVDNGQTRGAPVVVEPHPVVGNLVGRLEFRGGVGTASTDFTLVRAGALQRANGGYLVLPALDLLLAPGAYEALKRSLKDRAVQVENPAASGPFAFASLNPEPMPLDVKVVLIGSPAVYQALLLADEDFRKLFKVKVEFDAVMPRTEENLRRYASFIATVCRREGIPHLTADAAARVAEYSSRLAEDQDKLSTRFNEIVDLILSAAIWAREEGSDAVTGQHVRRALREKAYRAGRVEEALLELTRRNTLLVDTTGFVVGQVNGLSVINLGDHAFGRPVRITARSWLGRRGVVHIERETRMSGHIHSKGVLTLAAYLAGLYAQDKPLSLSASLAFEQMYEEIEGDSAASAELYALLSELSGVPVDQGIAVTGSVNQKGEVQPVGGVNEKIEGFFRLCQARGLTGSQGVLIPAANVQNLALSDEVVEAVAEGRFHVWAASTVDEGITILTGVPAGQRDASGRFPPGTVHGLADERLRAFAERLGRDGGGSAEA